MEKVREDEEDYSSIPRCADDGVPQRLEVSLLLVCCTGVLVIVADADDDKTTSSNAVYCKYFLINTLVGTGNPTIRAHITLLAQTRKSRQVLFVASAYSSPPRRLRPPGFAFQQDLIPKPPQIPLQQSLAFWQL